MAGFVLLVGSNPALDSALARSSAVASSTMQHLALAARQPGWLLLASEDTLTISLGTKSGFVIGDIFWRDQPDASVHIDNPQAQEIIRSHGRWLTKHVWGGYLAIFSDTSGSTPRVMRDPSGAFPVYHVEADGFTAYFNDIDLPIALGLVDPVPNPEFARHWLGYPNFRTARTALPMSTSCYQARRARETALASSSARSGPLGITPHRTANSPISTKPPRRWLPRSPIAPGRSAGAPAGRSSSFRAGSIPRSSRPHLLRRAPGCPP